MEKTKVITKLDYRTLKYVNLYLIKYRKKAHIWFIVTGLIAIAIAIYGLVALEDNIIFPIIGGVFAVYSIYQIFNIEKRLDLNLERFFYNRPVTNQIIELDSEKITLTRSNDPAPTDFDWTFITEIFEIPEFYIFMSGKTIPIIIDRSEEALLEGTKQDLDHLIRDKASMKPYRRIDFDIMKSPITYVHHDFPPEEVVDVESEVIDSFGNIVANDELDDKDYRDFIASDELKEEKLDDEPKVNDDSEDIHH